MEMDQELYSKWFKMLGDMPDVIKIFLLNGLYQLLMDNETQESQNLMVNNLKVHYDNMRLFIAVNPTNSDDILGNYVATLLGTSYGFMSRG